MSIAKGSSTAEGEIDYDFLILATGARHSYFGNDRWEKFAPGLKSLDDALEIRRRMLLAFEIAEKTEDDDDREAAMTFVVVGGGPTGVEMAGAIAEIARVTLVKDFRHIDSSQARVLLIENAPRVIPQFTSDLSESARRQLFDLGVEVRLRTLVEDVSAEGVTLKGGEKIPARTVIWAAGNAASPLGATLGVPLDRQGRVIVKEDCSIPGHRDVFVIGDLAHFGGETPLPGLSPVAHATGPPCGASDRDAARGRVDPALRVFRQGHHGDDRPQQGGRGCWIHALLRAIGVAGLAVHPRSFSHQLPQQGARVYELGLRVPDLRSQRALDYRTPCGHERRRVVGTAPPLGVILSGV
ncbi:MAG: FAD-dependent oxidoreductase [Chthoniobacter sp.]